MKRGDDADDIDAPFPRLDNRTANSMYGCKFLFFIKARFLSHKIKINIARKIVERTCHMSEKGHKASPLWQNSILVKTTRSRLRSFLITKDGCLFFYFGGFQ